MQQAPRDETMKEQLKRFKQPSNNQRPLPNPAHLGEDGETHINIWDQGSTEIGRFLSHSSDFTFVHDIFWRFRSMDGFWHYIRSEERDDRMRVMTSSALRRFSGKLTKIRVPQFRAMIADANWQKIKQYPDMLKAIKESTLPFDCYYISHGRSRANSGLRVRPIFSYWLLEAFEEIRRALKDGRDPNFDFLKEDKEAGIYDEILKDMETTPVQKHSEEPKKVNEGIVAEDMVLAEVNLDEVDDSQLAFGLKEIIEDSEKENSGKPE